MDLLSIVGTVVNGEIERLFKCHKEKLGAE
jgi:hypothetical protein